MQYAATRADKTGATSWRLRRAWADVTWRQRLYAAMLQAIVVPAAGMLISDCARAQGAPDEQPARFWADFGLGFGVLDTSRAPGGGSDGGVFVDLTIGGRVSDRWLLGVNIGGAGSQISNSNYDSSNGGSNVYGQAITNIFLAAQFEPGVDRGWFYGVGAGQVLYHNRDLERISGNARSGDGTGFLARIGYDWHTGRHLHVSAQLSLESARVSLSSPFSGSFQSTAVGLSAHVSHY